MTWRRGSMPAQSQPDSSRAPTGRPTEAQKPEGHLEWIGDFSQVSSIYRPAPSRDLRRKFGGVGRCFVQRVPAGLAPGAGQAPLIRDLTQKATFCRGGGARIVPQPPFALLEREPNRALAALPFSPG